MPCTYVHKVAVGPCFYLFSKLFGHIGVGIDWILALDLRAWSYIPPHLSPLCCILVVILIQPLLGWWRFC